MSSDKNQIWDQYAASYDTINFSIAYQDLLRQIVDNLQLSAGMVLLDLGCGTGNLEQKIAGQNIQNLEITAIDMSNAMIGKAREKKYPGLEVNFIKSDIEGNTLEELLGAHARFDRIVTIHFLYTVEKPEQVLREMHRVLQPDGIVVLAEPGPNAKFWPVMAENFSRVGYLKTLASLAKNTSAMVNNIRVNQQLLGSKLGQGRRSGLDDHRLSETFSRVGFKLVKKIKTYAGQDYLYVLKK